MKDWMHLPLAALVAVLVGAASALVATPERPARGAGNEAGELRATLAELRAEQERLAAALAALPAPTTPAPASARPTEHELDEAVAAYMERQIDAEVAAAQATNGAEGAADPDSAALADRILFGELSSAEVTALWEKLRKEGRIDGVLAAIEREAELAPNNPDLQSELGKAYLQKLFDVGIGPMAGVWGEKADKAFDHALELDETHWEARFQKAMALSNWPTFLGKQPESIRQFELLVAQQERSAPAREHALTYYFLGNLYDQMGQHDKAVATWQNGVARFPEDARLRQKTEGH